MQSGPRVRPSDQRFVHIQVSVSGGTAAFYHLKYKDPPTDEALRKGGIDSQRYWIGKDASHALCEIDFYLGMKAHMESAEKHVVSADVPEEERAGEVGADVPEEERAGEVAGGCSMCVSMRFLLLESTNRSVCLCYVSCILLTSDDARCDIVSIRHDTR